MTRKMNLQGAAFIGDKFPGRHSTIWGDSQVTLPRFVQEHKMLGKFVDLAFVDGGHSLVCCLSDIMSVRAVMRPNGIVIVDDVKASGSRSWEQGPSAAWRKCIQDGVVKQLGRRGCMAWGRFAK